MQPTDHRAFAVIAVISAVTIALRATPFLAIEKLSANRYLRFLGEKMPTGVMILLVAYTLKDDDFTRAPYGLPTLVALLIAIVGYVATRNALLSIGIALTTYLVAVNVIL